MNAKAAQQLFDDLWRAGFRPQKNGEGGIAHVEAMRDHIEDLRRLVFGKQEQMVDIKAAVEAEGTWGGS